VSTQYLVEATPEPDPSDGVSVTVTGLVDVHVEEELSEVVGGAESTVLIIAVAVPVPPLLVALIFKVNVCPLLPVIPVFEHVHVGLEPDKVATAHSVSHTPSVDTQYSQDVISLSLSVKVVVRSNGLSKKLLY